MEGNRAARVDQGPQKEADPGTVAHECGRLGDAIGQMETAISRTENYIQRPPRDENMKSAGPATIPAAQRSALSSRISDLTNQIDRLTARIEYVNEAL